MHLSIRSLALLFCACLFACQSPDMDLPVISNDQPDLNAGSWVDLSYTYDENTIYWPTADGFQKETVFEGNTDDGYYYSAFNFTSAEHGGTHLDAPIHFSEGKESVDELDLDQLIGPAILIDVSANALADKDYLISIQDIQDWEADHGMMPDNIIILLRTGYGQFWPDRKNYMGTALLGQDGVDNLHFPGLDPAAATWLVENRKVKALGLDTPSIDFGQSKLFESHQILFKESIPAFENLANLDKVTGNDLFVVALPMKIKGGSGGPLRIVVRQD